MKASDVVVVSAIRTAIGNFNGSLSSLSAHKLGELLISYIMATTKMAGEEVSEVILGQILCAGSGQNPARQAAYNAGLPKEVPAWLINQMCGSGLKGIALAHQSISLDHAKIVITGGQESMSQSPHVIHLRHGIKMGEALLIDSMMKDGLVDAFSNVTMGMTAENLAKQFNVSREEQDKYATMSHNRAEEASKNGRFKDEIVPITIASKTGDTIFDHDEFIRLGVTFEALSKLRPAFIKDGTVTAGNASGINDGAAMVMLMKRSEAEKRGLKPLATIRSFAQAGVAPEIMGTGPIPASRKALELASWEVKDLDLVEANEAFAVQSIIVNRELGFDPEKTNVNGGAVALGHPIGASGARVLVTLIHEMQKRQAKKGLATLCVGGGMGVAMCIELD